VGKKRPRVSKPPSKLAPAHWRERLFKNTYTYKGRHVEVRGWSVKIQLFGKRKTFSLSARDRAQAAGEACELYQTILAHGWEGAAQGSPGAGLRFKLAPGPLTSPVSIASDVEYWRRRLVHRKYPEEPGSHSGRDLSVRIEHAGTSRYFPLETSDEMEAAGRAMRIYQTVVRKGWAEASAGFPRELSLALRWQDNPVAWTYTTIHTWKSNGPARPVTEPSNRRPGLGVIVIEPDDGTRLALTSCVNSQAGFRCEAAFVSVAEALGEMPRRKVEFVLVNHDPPPAAGAAGWEEIQGVKPGLVGVFYSVFEDADQLFKATPGGAILYMLQRTAPFRILDPIAGLARPVRREQIVTHVRDYFQRLAASLPSSPPSREIAKLTPREHEILALLSKGDLAKEIADTLGISFWTVQGHVKSIFEKLGVHSRIEAVVKFLQK
jgi:DNA-binding NarL/FixJ family response regulator